jgi:YbbR domain-containing protein
MLSSLSDNWVLKLLSLAFALVLWFFVMGERKLEVGYTVPLELKNVPEGMMVGNEVPSLIDVRLSGPRTLLMNLSPKDISISVELVDLKPGLTSFKRLEERLNIPSGVKVTRLSPSFIDVKLERIREKVVPLKVVFSGIPAEGFQLGAVRLKPDQVTVQGAESEIKDITEVTTDPVDVEGAKESFTLMVPISYRGKYTWLNDSEAVEVRVSVEPLPSPASEKKSGRSQ